MSPKNEEGKKEGLSLTTLLIASCSSVAAALFIHKFWQGGAILGAAFTPVIVALVSEGLRKPVEAVKTRGTTVNPPPVAPDPADQRTPREREDRFGIWEDQKAPRTRRRIPVKLAVATGVAAFLIAAFFMTGAELVLGGATDSDRFRFVPGKQQKKDGDRRDRDDAPGATQPDEQEQPPPETTTPEDVPPETVPEEEVPEETVPPPETVPAPTPTTPQQPAP